MTEKRFTIIDKQFISYYGGDGHQISDGECTFWLWHNKEESQKVCDKLNKIIDENGQLKSTIKDVVELLSEEVDVFSDKATEHDINTYMELKKLDNKDAYYIAIATKKAIKMLKEVKE